LVHTLRHINRQTISLSVNWKRALISISGKKYVRRNVMAGEIIRMGDPTSHGGKVIEGSMTDICHGKPIAYMGHQTYCPQCKGNFPIIEGAPTTMIYGKGVALAGMKTACGAVLIAAQFTDSVEYAAGGRANADSGADRNPQTSNQSRSGGVITAAPSAPVKASNASLDGYDLYFRVIDTAGTPLIDCPYRIEIAGGEPVEGRTDSKGNTSRVVSKEAARATLHVYDPDVTPINPNWDH
jgi:uncharacterized Zn-binding protein involved in type VI secretion